MWNYYRAAEEYFNLEFIGDIIPALCVDVIPEFVCRRYFRRWYYRAPFFKVEFS